jgi:hypothetical protein
VTAKTILKQNCSAMQRNLIIEEKKVSRDYPISENTLNSTTSTLFILSFQFEGVASAAGGAA